MNSRATVLQRVYWWKFPDVTRFMPDFDWPKCIYKLIFQGPVDIMEVMITIRKAVQEDVPLVLPMVRRICQQHKELDLARYDYLGDPSKKYETWLLERPADARSVFLVAEYNDEAVHELAGYLVGTVEHELAIYRLNEYGFVHDLWVESDARGEGVGKGLITSAVQAFAQIGVEQVRLTTAADNEIARAMFISCGFVPSSVEMLCVIPANAPTEDAASK